MILLRIVMMTAVMLGTGCSTRTDLPIERSVLAVRHTPDGIICLARLLSKQQRLRFYYGTYNESFGKAVTFRMIGDGFELILVNPTEGIYDLSAYDIAKNGSSDLAARRAFASVKAAISAALPKRCVTMNDTK